MAALKTDQVHKAVAALLKFDGQKDQTNLLAEDERLYLVSARWSAHACSLSLREHAGFRRVARSRLVPARTIVIDKERA